MDKEQRKYTIPKFPCDIYTIQLTNRSTVEKTCKVALLAAQGDSFSNYSLIEKCRKPVLWIEI